MTGTPQDDHHCGQTSGLGEPFYFASHDHKLFGWLHRPSGGHFRGTGLVICKPFGYEAVCSHKGMRAFAEAAAAVGVPALRFDYLGTGDSADIDPNANQIDVWSKDVLSAIGELQRRTGVERVSVLGIRLGALLATLAAMQCDSIASLILISPIISGRRYLRELRTTRLAGSAGADSADLSSGPTGDNEPVNDGSMQVSGFLLSAATLAALVQVDLAIQRAPPVGEMLIIDGTRLPIARKWAEALSATTARTQYLELPGLIEMIMTVPHDAKTPMGMLGAIRDWLLSVPERQYAEGSNTPPYLGETYAPTVALELPGDALTPDSTLTERPVFLASKSPVFGILTEPRQDEARRRAVILVNAGATYHIGPNRFYVSLARRWARRGYFVMRMDLSGLGESASHPGRPENEVFPPSALVDIRAAIDFVRTRYGIEDLTLCGFCSGAYHALRAAAAAAPVNRILMVNLENFFWKEGANQNGLELAEVVKRTREHRDRVFSTAAWQRLLTGQVDILRILRIYVQRPLVAMESVVRECARRLHVPLPRDVGRELEEIGARGVRIAFVFARGEGGIDLLRLQGGSSVKRLGDRCHVHIIDRADHVFSQAGPSAALEKVLSSELFAQDRSRRIPVMYGPGLEPNRRSATAPVFAVPESQSETMSRHPK